MTVPNTAFRSKLELESEKVLYDCGWVDCEERIIKIISEWDFPVNQGIYTVDDSIKSLIALIKGEEVNARNYHKR